MASSLECLSLSYKTWQRDKAMTVSNVWLFALACTTFQSRQPHWLHGPGEQQCNTIDNLNALGQSDAIWELVVLRLRHFVFAEVPEPWWSSFDESFS